jgi:hypothetical protein
MKLDDADIQAIAERVVDLLTSTLERQTADQARSILHQSRPAPEPSGLVDAATLAHVLGVEREWVYQHAKQLGAVRLGGPRGRLRFDLATIDDRLDSSPYEQAADAAHRRCGAHAVRRRACTAAQARPKILSQASTAGRRGNAPGPTPGGHAPMQNKRTRRRAS